MTSVDTMCLALIKMTTLTMTMLRTMDGNCFMATFSAFHHIARCSVQYLVSCIVVSSHSCLAVACDPLCLHTCWVIDWLRFYIAWHEIFSHMVDVTLLTVQHTNFAGFVNGPFRCLITWDWADVPIGEHLWIIGEVFYRQDAVHITEWSVSSIEGNRGPCRKITCLASSFHEPPTNCDGRNVLILFQCNNVS